MGRAMGWGGGRRGAGRQGARLPLTVLLALSGLLSQAAKAFGESSVRASLCSVFVVFVRCRRERVWHLPHQAQTVDVWTISCTVVLENIDMKCV
jgi:hypothetical protein